MRLHGLVRSRDRPRHCLRFRAYRACRAVSGELHSIVLLILNLFAIAISDRSQSVAPRPHKRSRAEAHTPRPGLGQRLAPNVCATHLAVDVATIADRSARALIWVNRRGCIVTSVSIPDLARLDPAGLGRVRPDSTGGQVWRPISFEAVFPGHGCRNIRPEAPQGPTRA
jgi:hypothetical protein